jgi:hypothetical protein
METQRQYFDWLAKELGVKTFEDWYKITREDLTKLGAGGLLVGHYKSSLPKGTS